LNKRSISAKAVVADIKNGLSDAELMSRHELSEGQLHNIFSQLVKAGYVVQDQLDGRRQQDASAASPEPPRPAQSLRHPVGPSPRQVSKPAAPQPSSLSLPLSREEAARVRRNGLILIIASYGFLTMGAITATLRKGAAPSPDDLVGFALGLIVPIGWIVAAILGCLWRVRGLGHHPFWAIVAPLFCGNLVVIEALSNRYEPESDRRGFRLTIAIIGALTWWIVVTLMIISVKGLPS
jgi:hypothetical protein